MNEVICFEIKTTLISLNVKNNDKITSQTECFQISNDIAHAFGQTTLKLWLLLRISTAPVNLAQPDDLLQSDLGH